MKRILCCTLLALFATLTPAFAAGRKSEGKLIGLDMTKYGSLQNAVGMAKAALGGVDQKETFGVVVSASVPDGTIYRVEITTSKGEVYEVAAMSMFLGTGVAQLSVADLAQVVGSVADIGRVTIQDKGGLVLEGSFYPTVVTD